MTVGGCMGAQVPPYISHVSPLYPLYLPYMGAQVRNPNPNPALSLPLHPTPNPEHDEMQMSSALDTPGAPRDQAGCDLHLSRLDLP